jgi:hypothetical protein
VLTQVLLTMLRRYSFESAESFRQDARRMARENEAARPAGDQDRGTLASQATPACSSLYMVELHFGRMANEADRRFFNSVPTRLQLPPKSVDRLLQIARSELVRNEEFRRLVSDLGGTATTGAR